MCFFEARLRILIIRCSLQAYVSTPLAVTAASVRDSMFVIMLLWNKDYDCCDSYDRASLAEAFEHSEAFVMKTTASNMLQR